MNVIRRTGALVRAERVRWARDVLLMLMLVRLGMTMLMARRVWIPAVQIQLMMGGVQAVAELLAAIQERNRRGGDQ